MRRLLFLPVKPTFFQKTKTGGSSRGRICQVKQLARVDNGERQRLSEGRSYICRCDDFYSSHRGAYNPAQFTRPMPGKRWHSIYDAVPVFTRHWADHCSVSTKTRWGGRFTSNSNLIAPITALLATLQPWPYSKVYHIDFLGPGPNF